MLENSTFRRVGGTGDIKVDVRIISATNQDIKEEISAGRFREDYVTVKCCPPAHASSVREKGRYPDACGAFSEKVLICGEEGISQVMKLFMECPWKGNVRRLENVIERNSAFNG